MYRTRGGVWTNEIQHGIQKTDEVIPQERYKEIYKELENSRIYDLTVENGNYIFYIDTEERTYTYTIKAKDDRETWERFMNKESM